MRFESTVGNDMVIDSPHRLLTTTDQVCSVIEGESLDDGTPANEVAYDPEFARQLAKQLLAKWIVDSLP